MSVWSAIEKSIQAARISDFSLSHQQVVSGGDISQAYVVSGNHQQFFVKINSSAFLGNFQQEVLGLSYLARCHQLVTPQVITTGVHQRQSFLVLEYLDLSQSGKDSCFAESLVSLHQITAQEFGFESNNYIGGNPQYNSWLSDWGQYFVEYRLRPQFELLFQGNLKSSIDNKVTENSETLMKQCRFILNSHAPQPSLVHGDLWQGNYAFDRHGNPVVYDPACYFADSEVDIAMLEMFGSPSAEFYSVYYQQRPPKSGIEIRKKIYNLYHLLNHANLFGGGYLSRVVNSIEQILKDI